MPGCSRGSPEPDLDDARLVSGVEMEMQPAGVWRPRGVPAASVSCETVPGPYEYVACWQGEDSAQARVIERRATALSHIPGCHTASEVAPAPQN